MGRKKKIVAVQVKNTDIKKYYVSVKTVHLGGLKRTVQKGTSIIHIKTDSGREYIEIDGEKIDNLNDFNICVRHKFFEETDQKTAEQSDKESKEVKQVVTEQKEEKKFPVYKSDEDLMPSDIDISYTKNEYMKKEKEEATKKNDIDEDKVVGEVRGMKILKESNQPISNKDEISMKVSVSKSADSADISKEINGETKEVAKISSEVKEEKTTSKRKPNAEASKRAAARKKESEQNQKKLTEEKAKK